MPETLRNSSYLPWPTGERRGPVDRRLGDRRLEFAAVETERRVEPDRRRPVGRRESAGGHIRNAIQVLEGALADAQRQHTSVDREAVVAALLRLRQALHEVDRLSADRSQIGRLFRVTERGLTPESFPGLLRWPRLPS